MPSILYVSDPLCAWCYAQGPQLRPLLEGLPELTVEVVAGGLRPYRREAPDSSVRDALTSQLLHVREKSGLPVHESLLSGEYLAGDSEPACRAVVAARRLSASAALPVFDAIQNAYFAEGRRIDDHEVLIEVATSALNVAGISITAQEFKEHWASNQAVEETAREIQQTRDWGITGFPTLVLARGASLDLVSSGFMLTEELIERMQAIVDQDAVAAA